METSKKILIVEDDETLNEALQLNLELEGYSVESAFSAEQAMKLNLASFDLILLDVMMGEISGFKFARLLKDNTKTAQIPIIFCTAKDSEDDMIAGLNIGADDYICKPYTMRNLLARVKTVLRRIKNTSEQQPESDSSISYKGIKIDRQFKRCFVDGNEVKMAKKELEILEMLISNPGRIFSRDEILDYVWRGEVIVLGRTVDVNITRIRHKIAPYGQYLITRPGYGYGFE